MTHTDITIAEFLYMIGVGLAIVRARETTYSRGGFNDWREAILLVKRRITISFHREMQLDDAHLNTMCT